MGDKYVVSETFTGTTGMTWCLAHLIRILMRCVGEAAINGKDIPSLLPTPSIRLFVPFPQKREKKANMTGECLASSLQVLAGSPGFPPPPPGPA